MGGGDRQSRSSTHSSAPAPVPAPAPAPAPTGRGGSGWRGASQGRGGRGPGGRGRVGRSTHGNQEPNARGRGSMPPRDPHRPFFDLVMKRKTDLVISNAADADRFFTAALSFHEDLELLHALVEDGKHCQRVLRAAFSLAFDGDDNQLNKAVAFLARLGSEQCNRGTGRACTAECYLYAYRTPGLVRALKRALEFDLIRDPEAIVWFLVSVCRESPEARENEAVHNISRILSSKEVTGAHSLAVVLQSGAAATRMEFMSLDDVRAMNPNHDNDFPRDYRKIAIVPTADELECTVDVCSVQSIQAFSGSSSDAAVSDASLLDRQFRLLREDMIAPLKHELREQMTNPQPRRVFFNPLAVGVDLTQNPCILVQVNPPRSLKERFTGKKKEMRSFLETKGRRILGIDSIVVFISQSRVQFVGVVAKRELSDFTPEVITIGVVACGDGLRHLIHHIQLEPGEHNRLVEREKLGDIMFQASTSLFAYEPVLRRLQNMVEVTFSEELVQGCMPSIVSRISLPAEVECKLREDRSQILAACRALNHSVTLIQGPPGTGKTFVGVQIARALISNSSSANPVRILCLCYTNHALDNFLESLLDDGLDINSIIRLGSVKKISHRLVSRGLNGEKTEFDRSQVRRYAVLKNKETGTKQECERLVKVIGALSSYPLHWRDMAPFLSSGTEEQRSAYYLLSVPVLDTDEHIVGRSGKKLKSDDRWRKWCGGEIIDNGEGEGFWTLARSDRKEMLENWRREFLSQSQDLLVEAIGELSQIKKRIKELQTEAKVPVAAQAVILGCTTTSAAKECDLLADVAPTVVIVEEAAEILEAHVLTTINKSVKRLILIGDHKQLPPKLEHYPLRKESRGGYNFDVSLFERLATQRPSFPVVQLNVQHRMRPEISRLIRHTYPSLEDHNSVFGRPNLNGVQRNVVFINHEYMESGDDEAEILGTNSKTNQHEILLTVEIVKFFIRQGYRSSDLVVLTPYLGQLIQLQQHLRSVEGFDVALGDLDSEELTRFDTGLESEDANDTQEHVKKQADGTQKPAVRVATIDNYQGEESKIVIASLVRSNMQNKLGFVGGAERVNVLLSRARDGLILIGNKTTLSSSPVWERVFDMLQETGCIYDGFPVICQRHKETLNLRTAEDFQRLAPSGGCDKSCNIALPSCPHGHVCPKRCHPPIIVDGNDISHKNIPCKELVDDKCSGGHDVKRECYNPTAKKCAKKVLDNCPEGHIRERRCCDPPLQKCKVCKQLEEKKRQADEKLREQALKLEDDRRKKQDELAAAIAELEQARLEENDRMYRQRYEREISLAKVETERLRSLVKPNSTNAARELLRTERQDTGKRWVMVNSAEAKSSIRASERKNLDVSTAEDDVARCLCQSQSQCKCNESSPTWNKPSSNEEIVDVQTHHPIEAESISEELSSNQLPPSPMLINRGSESKETHSRKDVYFDQHNSAQNAANLVTLKRMVGAAWNNDWLQVFKLSEVPRAGTTFQEAEDAVKALSMVAALKLGDEADSMLFDIAEVETRLTEVQDSWWVAVTHLSAAIIEHAADVAPLTAKHHARSYLALHDRFSDDLHTQWKEEANSILSYSQRPNRMSTAVPAASSLAAADWEHCKQQYKAKHTEQESNKTFDTPSASIDSLMKMIGLEEVKQELVRLYQRMVIAEEQGMSSCSSLNSRFDGNPGTGKTSVARLYAEFLIDMNVLPKDSHVFETSGSGLLNLGVGGLRTKLEEMKDVGGGAIFIDEAYQLNPNTNPQARQILDFVLAHSESLRGEYGALVWVMAGYHKEMEKLFEYNPGLPSRFPLRFRFEDYSDEELLSIFNQMLKPPPVTDSSKARAAPKSKAPVISIRSGIQYQNSRPDQKDAWGNTWSWYPAEYTWKDEFDNITGIGVQNLGTASNPLISRKTRKAWIHDGKKWSVLDNPSVTQKHYPGTPAHVPSSRARPFTVTDPKWSRIAIKRLSRNRGTVGFGNARAVRNLFDSCLKRQAQRISTDQRRGRNPNLFHLTRDDLLGPRADNEALENSAAWSKLRSLEGLSEVKNAVKMLIDLVIQNATREEEEKPLLQVSLNRLFLGNPGTGKTTVAKLYAQILADLGLLSKGEVVFKTASDFVGGFLGTSQQLTRSILEASQGCVLVIDEAYGLNPCVGAMASSRDPYKEAVIDTIVEQVQGEVGADRAVVMIGYREEMTDMLKNANPGLARRFQLDNAFEFSDYDDAALVRILRKAAKEDGVKITASTATFAVTQLARARALPHFGNAGAVKSMLSEAKIAMQSRNAKLPSTSRSDTLLPQDFDKNYSEGGGKQSDIFAGLVGCDSVVKRLREYRASLELAKMLGQDPREVVEFNFVFAGPPGTGKTTVARRMGRMFHELGLLPFDEVVEKSASDLMTGYVGQTGKTTKDIMTSARGKVLFIDEAYQLNPRQGGTFVQEAVDELVKCLTSTELKGQMVVILAGYERDMDAMLSVNEGLRSRFSEKICFEEFSTDLSVRLLKLKLKENHLQLCDEAKRVLTRQVSRLKNGPNFGSGRDIENLSKKIFRCVAESVSVQTGGQQCPEGPSVSAQHVEDAVSALLATKGERRAQNTPSEIPAPSQFASALDQQLPEPPPRIEIAPLETKTEELSDVDEEESAAVPPSSNQFTRALQDVLDQRGLNNAEGVAHLTRLSLEDTQMQELANAISSMLDMPVDAALDKLREWQVLQVDVQAKLEEQRREEQLAKRQKRKALVPIWRCAACGRADQPFIVCHVAPFVVRYEERELP